MRLHRIRRLWLGTIDMSHADVAITPYSTVSQFVSPLVSIIGYDIAVVSHRSVTCRCHCG